MNTYYIYFHGMGHAFDSEVDTLHKVIYQASNELNARQFFYNDYPNGTIWSIDTED